MSQGQRRLAAIMFTDMVGYTALGQRNESLSLYLVDEQRKLIRPILRRHNGREVKTIGDAFLIEFTNALDAARCAYDIQRASREFNFSQPEERRIRLRVGLHVGDVEESNGDIFGDAVNVASRIEPLAEDGGVCVTRQVHDNIQNKFDLPLASLGSRRLKNVNAMVDVYKIVMPWEQETVSMPSQLDRKRVAVLPFANMTPDPNEEYFADGTTEEMISTLSNISGLTVISRTSVMQYKGVKKNLSEIGKELRAGTILEGSVRKSGNRVRIAVQLLDPTEDKHLWVQNYDRELQDVFAVQSDVAMKVAEYLRVRLLANETRQIQKKPTENMDAYLLYLRGKQHWSRGSEEDTRKAIELFRLAIGRDPNFALAFVGLTEAYLVLFWLHAMSREEIGEEVRKAATRALELDENLPEAHVAKAILVCGPFALDKFDWDAAEVELKRAIELNDSYARAHWTYSFFLRDLGRFEEALAEAKKGLELDPITPLMSDIVGARLRALERYDEAIEYFARAVAIEPDYYLSLDHLAITYALKGDFDQAMSWWEKSAKVDPSKARIMISLALIQALRGNRAGALNNLDIAMKERDASRQEPVSLATVFAVLQDEERAFELLENAAENHILVAHARAEPLLKTWRSNPRFLNILKKQGLEKYLTNTT